MITRVSAEELELSEGTEAYNPFPRTSAVSAAVLKIFFLDRVSREMMVSFHNYGIIAFG
jgi:hypothetical protein